MRGKKTRRSLTASLALLALVHWAAPAAAAPPWADDLATDHDDLGAEHGGLSADHDGLSAEHGTLESDHDGLSDQIDAVSDEIDSTLRAWDRRIDDASERFVVLSDFDDEAVLDRETQLVWQRAPNATTRPWAPPLADEFGGARFICAGSWVGQRLGWRLPTLQEFQTLMQRFQNDPALLPGHPFVLPGPSGLYWTATTVAHDPTRAYLVRLGDGGVNLRSKSNSALSWCVRGRQTGSDTY